MSRTTIFSLFALAAGVGGALAAGVGLEKDAAQVDCACIQSFAYSDARLHAAVLFERADIDQDGAVSADEFAALNIVTAELAALNGYAVFNTADGERMVALANAQKAIAPHDRAFIEAKARGVFYAFANEDAQLNESEFVSLETARFEAADRNRDGALRKSELQNFAGNGRQPVA